MATKTDLITAINTQLTAIITQAKVRLASLAIVNELYTEQVTDTQITNNNFESILANLEYSITTSKNGNTLNGYGYLKNNTGAIVGSVSLFELINSDYLPLVLGDISNTPVSLTSKSGTVILISTDGSNEFRLIGSLGVGEKIYFNFNYKTTL